ncbi:MAG: phosphoribosyltransferase family protein [Acidimicrobiia bacterium]|nr:phosphoribosyltransferase family protein [Acidimicrobiia bacterium]
MRYVDRSDAGRRITPDVAAALRDSGHSGAPPLILGVPRGGVVVAAEVAAALDGELDVALATKIGAPHNPELAIGAVGESGEPDLAEGLIHQLAVGEEYLAAAIKRARSELQRRAGVFRGDRTPPNPHGRVTVVVDDGIATGATLRATLRAVRAQRPSFLVCAVPVGPRDSVADLATHSDAMVCPMQPRWFRAVGEWYDIFTQTSDAEVIRLLENAGSGGQAEEL